MTSPSDSGGTPPVGAPTPPFTGSTPSNWREALMGLIYSRAALIELEMKEAIRSGVRRSGLYIGSGILLLFSWALTLTATIGWISAAWHWPWYCVVLGAALLHLILAGILLLLAKSPVTASFAVTRAEFKKDREWIENFQHTKKSND